MRISTRIARLAFAVAAVVLAAGAVQAESPAPPAKLRYACTTTMRYLPSPMGCRGGIPADTESAIIEFDLAAKTWNVPGEDSSGKLDVLGNSLILQQWGGREGRDATLDRSSGTFDYHTQSGCLVESETGTCQPAPP